MRIKRPLKRSRKAKVSRKPPLAPQAKDDREFVAMLLKWIEVTEKYMKVRNKA